MTKPQEIPNTTIRFEPAVRARLDAWCEANDRSLNWATNQLITKALDAEGWPPADSSQPDAHQQAHEE